MAWEVYLVYENMLWPRQRTKRKRIPAEPPPQKWYERKMCGCFECHANHECVRVVERKKIEYFVCMVCGQSRSSMRYARGIFCFFFLYSVVDAASLYVWMRRPFFNTRITGQMVGHLCIHFRLLLPWIVSISFGATWFSTVRGPLSAYCGDAANARATENPVFSIRIYIFRNAVFRHSNFSWFSVSGCRYSNWFSMRSYQILIRNWIFILETNSIESVRFRWAAIVDNLMPWCLNGAEQYASSLVLLQTACTAYRLHYLIWFAAHFNSEIDGHTPYIQIHSVLILWF